MIDLKNRESLFYKVGNLLFPVTILILLILSLNAYLFLHLTNMANNLININFGLISLASLFLGTRNLVAYNRKITSFLNYLLSLLTLVLLITRIL